MTLIELQATLKSGGLTAILVENATPDDERKRLLFSGSLAEYLEVAKSLEARAVIVYSETLEGSDFLADSIADSEEDDDTNDGDDVAVDLCSINTKLTRFKDRLGEHGLFWLSIPLHDEHLDLALEEPWWREFLDLRDNVVGEMSVEQRQRTEAAQSRANAEAKAILARLHALVDDSKFACLPTQKAMFQYAVRKIPELKDLSPADLKAEIQELKAKIDANVG